MCYQTYKSAYQSETLAFQPTYMSQTTYTFR